MESNSFSRIEIIASDIKQVEFAEETRFSTALIDVDLYMPAMAALEKIFPGMRPGGSIVLNHMKGDNRWDGARAAFQDFIEKRSITSSNWVGTNGELIRC